MDIERLLAQPRHRSYWRNVDIVVTFPVDCVDLVVDVLASTSEMLSPSCAHCCQMRCRASGPWRERRRMTRTGPGKSKAVDMAVRR